MTRLLIALSFALSVVAARAQAPQTPRPVALAVYPSVLWLDGEHDVSRLIVVATFSDGTTRDVTEACELNGEGRDLVERADDDRWAPRRNGEGPAHVTFEGLRADLKVNVRAAKTRLVPHFELDVIPVLTRQGCNAGGCHGSATGKNGFHLSLFGYDPKGDHDRLARELRGRRLNLAEPPASLMLRKPSLQLPHKGGEQLPRDSVAYERLMTWIEAGAPYGAADAPRLTGIELGPPEVILEGAGARQRVIVHARYADGRRRDVTDLSRLSTSNDASAKVEAGGAVVSDGPGEAFIMARFGGLAVVTPVLVLESGKAPVPAGATPASYVDGFIEEKLRKMRVASGPLASDETFLRRVYLDVIGVPPTVAETKGFLANPDRAALVDALLKRPELADVWALHWAEVLKIRGTPTLRGKSSRMYVEFLRSAFDGQRTFDEVVRQILTAEGASLLSAPANFYVVDRDPKVCAETAAQVFLGIRIQCAQCHDHPFERWTMGDYYGFAAFFAQVGRKRSEDPRGSVVFHRGSGGIDHPLTGQRAKPKLLGGAEPKLESGADPRAALADWMLAEDNEYFAANVANRVFARFFGRGLVEPVDDVRVSNPPSHPRLHRELARRLVGYGFDVRPLIRDLVLSEAYQRAAGRKPAAGFAKATARRLTAEQLHDAIGIATGVPTSLRGRPEGATAASAVQAKPNDFLEVFGRPGRASACTCERRSDPTLGQALHLINGRTISDKIKSDKGRLRLSLAAGRSDRDILDELYLASLCRLPTEAEAAALVGEIAAAEDRRAAFEDVFWVLLNAKEFLFNH